MAANPLFRGVTRQFSDASRAAAAAMARLAAATSLGEASATAYTFELYASESVLAALRASMSSAARRASVLGVACAAPNRSSGIALRAAFGLFSGEESRLTSVFAAANRPASSIAAPNPSAPSASLLFAFHATEWVRVSLAIRPAATAAWGERSDPISPTTAAAARDKGIFFEPRTSSPCEFFDISPADARAAAHLFPFGPFMFTPSTTSAPSAFTPGSSTAESTMAGVEPDVHDLISLMNATDLNFEEEVLFRRAFNAKHQNFTIADVGSYLENHSYTFEEMRYVLKIVHRKIGHHKGLMEFLIKEEMLYGRIPEVEFNDNPVLTRVEAKLDGTIKRLEIHLHTTSEFMRTEKRTRLFSRVIDFISKIFGGF